MFSNFRALKEWIRPNKWFFMYIAALIVIGYVIIPIYYQFHPVPPPPPDPAHMKAKADLQHEFEILKPLPGTVLKNEPHSIGRGGAGGHSETIIYNYSTRSNKSEVYEHYRKELEANGWMYYRAEKKYPSREHGMVFSFSEVYKKGGYFVAVTHGSREDGDNIFILDFSWRPK